MWKNSSRTRGPDKNHKYVTFLHNSEISISGILDIGMLVSRIVRLLKSPKEKSLIGEELQITCSKCGKRPATDQDGLCKQCRFDDILTKLTDKK